MAKDQSKLLTLKQYTTAPHACSYLPEQEASTLFIDPQAPIDEQTYSTLSERGYRRSGHYLYKPDCLHCNACISLRIPAKKYQFSRSDKRIFKRNADLVHQQVEHIFQDEYYQLYRNYINVRHNDGDMYPPSLEQYVNFLNNAYGNTQFHTFSDSQGQLLAVAVVDKLENAFSAVYTFYEPNDNKRSLGTYAILWQLFEAQRQNIDYVYLGYWIKQCTKMRYKTRFRPAEILINQRWLTLL